MGRDVAGCSVQKSKLFPDGYLPKRYKSQTHILTQAMQILVDRGVELKTHGIFFNRATTAVSIAIPLASTMGTAAGLVGITFGAPIVAVTGSLLAMTSLVIKAVNNTNPGLLK